jgi:ketopantoate reductase
MSFNVGEVNRSGLRETMIIPMMTELVAIAAADGYTLSPKIVQNMAYALPNDADYRPSMLLDADHGREMEIDAILGAPLRKAKELGVPAPKLQSVYDLLSAREWGLQNGVQRPGEGRGKAWAQETVSRQKIVGTPSLS